MIKIKIKKLKDNAIIPTKSTDEAAAFDLYAIEDFVVGCYRIVKAKTGISVEIPKGYCAVIRPRSGLASKYGIVISSSGIVDSDYRGEWIVPLYNNAGSNISSYYEFAAGDRIAQFLILPVPEVELVESDELNVTNRDSAGFGSSGK